MRGWSPGPREEREFGSLSMLGEEGGRGVLVSHTVPPNRMTRRGVRDLRGTTLQREMTPKQLTLDFHEPEVQRVSLTHTLLECRTFGAWDSKGGHEAKGVFLTSV